jgi:AraC-like DNA-binding protein
LDYAVPSADLSDYVTLFYCFSADVPSFEDVERADNAQLRFRLSDGAARYEFYDGTVQCPVAAHVIGPTSGPIRSSAIGPVRVFGMGLTAAGWTAMIGSEASSALNRVIDANTIFGAARLRTAVKALTLATDITESAAIGEALVRDLVRNGHPGVSYLVRQIEDWLAGSPSPDIDDLVATTGLSRRQVERRCKAAYGAPPKLLARKYRALRAASALTMDDARIDDVIARGFYDQSHLIREVKQFTGLTPRQLRAQPTILRHLTISQRTALGGRVSPLISDT